jgi:citrate synthase
MWALPANGHPMDVLQTTIASMATFYPDAGAQDPNSAYTQSALTKIIHIQNIFIGTAMQGTC